MDYLLFWVPGIDPGITLVFTFEAPETGVRIESSPVALFESGRVVEPMSDTDDEFDREAEREKLRKKYERDKEKREVTERMSDLLLKGATMTNKHCGTCGSPIFRHDGQAFCPTCQEPVSQDGHQAAEDVQQPEEAPPAPNEHSRPQELDPDRPSVETATEARSKNTDSVGGDRTDAQSTRNSPPVDDEYGVGDETPTETSPSPRQSQTQDEASGSTTRSGDLDATEASLTRTLTELARRAEETTDLGRKRDFLDATREAAEALQAVREAYR